MIFTAFLTPCRGSAYAVEIGVKQKIIWDVVMTFMDIMEKRGSLQSRRQQQTLDWVWQMTEEQLRSEILNNPAVIARTAEVREEIVHNRLSATQAAQALLDTIRVEVRKS